MDRRQQKSRAAILNAFEHLLTNRNYNKITVQDIIDEANVGRTTFYAHFDTKDALLEELCTQLFDHVFTDQPDNHHPFCLSHGDSRTIVTHLLYHLQDNGRPLAKLLTGESGDVFLLYFRDYLDRLLEQTLLSGLNRRNLTVPEDFLQNHVSGSFVNMVQWWLRRGMKESPAQLADHFLAVIEPIL